MKRLTLMFILLAAAPLAAQKNRSVHIGYVYPAGGQAGTEMEVVVGGSGIRRASAILISGSGVQAGEPHFFQPFKHLIYVRQLRDEVNRNGCLKRPDAGTDAQTGATPKAKKTAAPSGGKGGKNSDYELSDGEVKAVLLKLSPLELRLLSGKVANLNNRLQQNPAIEQLVVCRIRIAADAAPGRRELRLKTPDGLSDPVCFVVGRLPEVNHDFLNFNRRSTRSFIQDCHIPAVLNGQILPGEIDTFRFHARAGQRLRIALAGRSLLPFLGDAVPGWFQPVMAVFDASGRELAYADDYRFDPDPVLRFEAPADGDYLLRVRDAIYRGREDFVYRVTLTDEDRSLPEPAAPVLPERFAGLPQVAEAETGSAAPVKLMPPVLVSGRIDRPGDADLYEFGGRRGEEVVCEILARRLGSPLDAALALYDASGKLLVVNDDFIRPNIGPLTHHADPYLRLRLPADGRYRLRVTDTVGQGGRDYSYRLRISPPRPSFAVYAGPSVLNVHAGTTVMVDVCAVREDGFDRELRIEPEKPLKGLTFSGNVIPPGRERTVMTLTVDRDWPVGLRELKLVAVEPRSGVKRPVTAADEQMQAFIYRHLVPAQQLLLNVLRRGYLPVFPSGGITRIPLLKGVPFTLMLNIRPLGAGSRLVFEPKHPAEDIVLRAEAVGDRQYKLIVSAAPNARPGTSGNLVVGCSVDEPVRTKDGDTGRRRTRELGILPAIPFTIIAGRTQ